MDPELRQAIIVLLKIYGSNRSKVAKALHVSRHTVAEVVDSEKVQAYVEDIDDSNDYIEEDNEIDHKMETLKKENQAILAELADAKSEHERLVQKSIRAWHQHQRQQNPVQPHYTLAQDVLCKMLRQKKLPSSFLKYVK